MKRRSLRGVLSVAAMLVATSAAVGQFEIPWWTVDGGGDMWSTGGSFELSGTIGQPDASPVTLTGGTCTANCPPWTSGRSA